MDGGVVKINWQDDGTKSVVQSCKFIQPLYFVATLKY